MKVTQLKLHHFTVFEDVTLDFSPGINVIIGANATGKTHALKLIYSMLKAAPAHQKGLSTGFGISDFGSQLKQKLVGVFRPFEGRPGRLVRKKKGRDMATVSLQLTKAPGVNFELTRLDRLGLSGDKVPEVPTCIYIPSREVLSFYHGFAYAYENRELDFDETYFDLCVALSGTPLRGPRGEAASNLIAPLHKAVLRDVTLSNEHFFLVAPGEGAVEAHLAAEGLRKIATLMHLIKNGALAKSSVLIWDEPEANLNPKLIGVIAELLMSLAAAGVQIFLSTHDYLLSSRLSLEAEYKTNSAKHSHPRFFALSRSKPSAPVTVDHGATLAELANNPILDEFAAFYEREQKYFSGNGQGKE